MTQMNRRRPGTSAGGAGGPSPKKRPGSAGTRRSAPRSPREAAECCGVIDDLLDPELFKALCDPTRARLVGCLIKCARPCTVSEVAECCAVDFSVVSRHLKLLARSGVLRAAKEGRTVSYAVRFAELCLTLRALADAIEGHGPNAGCACGGGRCGKR